MFIVYCVLCDVYCVLCDVYCVLCEHERRHLARDMWLKYYHCEALVLWVTTHLFHQVIVVTMLVLSHSPQLIGIQPRCLTLLRWAAFLPSRTQDLCQEKYRILMLVSRVVTVSPPVSAYAWRSRRDCLSRRRPYDLVPAR